MLSHSACFPEGMDLENVSCICTSQPQDLNREWKMYMNNLSGFRWLGMLIYMRKKRREDE